MTEAAPRLEPTLTPEDIAGFTGLSYHSVLREVHDGRLRAAKIRGRIIIKPEWYDAWLEGAVVEPADRVARGRADTPSASPRKPRAADSPGSLGRLRAIEGTHG